MIPRRTSTLAAVVAVIAATTGGTVLAGATQAAERSAHGNDSFSFAVIGDVPYGETLQQHFPAFIEQVNADSDVRMVTHLGDIKSGSTTCDDQRFAEIRRAFDRFDRPLVYTPGDNEWTDCHRVSNGGYRPLERLATVRGLFFDRPGRTLGRRVAVRSQADLGFPENVRYTRAGVAFATLHVVGSNNDLAPWDGIGLSTPTREQVAEERARMTASIANLREAFRTARDGGQRAVVLMQQADMFDGTVSDPDVADYSAFRPLVQAIITEANRFDGPVYLFNGDSHSFNADRPLAAGSRWLRFYGVNGSAENLTRYTVDGSDKGEMDWLEVTIHHAGPDLLTVERVPAS